MFFRVFCHIRMNICSACLFQECLEVSESSHLKWHASKCRFFQNFQHDFSHLLCGKQVWHLLKCKRWQHHLFQALGFDEIIFGFLGAFDELSKSEWKKLNRNFRVDEKSLSLVAHVAKFEIYGIEQVALTTYLEFSQKQKNWYSISHGAHWWSDLNETAKSSGICSRCRPMDIIDISLLFQGNHFWWCYISRSNASRFHSNIISAKHYAFAENDIW